MPMGSRRKLAQEVHLPPKEHPQRNVWKTKQKFQEGFSREGGHLSFIRNLQDIPLIGVDNRGLPPLQRAGPLRPIVEMHMPVNEILGLVFV